MDLEDSGQGAFLDIATNLLAIILIVTLFSLVSMRHATQTAAHPAARPVSSPRFVEPRRELFPPFSRFFFVVSGRVVRWDQESVVAALIAAPDALFGTTAQGRFEWLPEPLVTRDIDTFQIRFFLDTPAILAQEPPWSEDATARLVSDLVAADTSSRIAPVFIVHPAGMETFVPLHERLQAAGLRFRWFAQKSDEPLRLGRHPEQFTAHAIYW